MYNIYKWGLLLEFFLYMIFKLKLDCFSMEMYSNRRPQPIGFGVEIKFELGTYLN